MFDEADRARFRHAPSEDELTFEELRIEAEIEKVEAEVAELECKIGFLNMQLESYRELVEEVQAERFERFG